MRWTTATTAAAATTADLLVVGVPQKDDAPDLATWKALDKALGGAVKAVAGGKVFNGAAESAHVMPGTGVKASWVMLLGLGPVEDLSLQTLRRCAALAVKRAVGLEARSVALALPWSALGDVDAQAAARACAEGGELSLFDAGTNKAKTRKDATAPRTVKVILGDGVSGAAVRGGLVDGEAQAAGCLRARTLVNMPPNELNPSRLATEARRIARSEGYACSVHGEAWLRKNGMGGILGVGQGSRQESKLVVMERRPKGRGKVPTIVLVGKGVTFDTGGISLKPGGGMHEMKGDMGGAAAVLGASLILARRDVKARIVVMVPTVENMPDGNAIRPGDVLTMASGKTVEVLNTDAEGRLILADALHHAAGEKPDLIIDAATLTGACVVALGMQFAGLFTNDGRLGDALQQAGGDVFERVWPMPLVEEHHKMIESPVADIKNIGGGRYAGASTAAAFLAEFVDEDTPWAHLDIAGPSWTEADSPLGPKGASGFGARLIARGVELYLDALAARDGS